MHIFEAQASAYPHWQPGIFDYRHEPFPHLSVRELLPFQWARVKFDNDDGGGNYHLQSSEAL